MRCESILDCIGGTPLVRLRRFSQPGGATVWAKLETFNPLGCVKDRAACFMIERAEARGDISPERTILVEPTSGNLGLGLALVSAVKGYRFLAVVPESMSPAKVLTMKHLGARVVFSPREAGAKGAIAMARSIVERNPSTAYLLDQFTNADNAAAHELTTGPEILADMSGLSLDAFVAGVGTGGTLTGVGRALRAARGTSVRIVAVEPAGSPVLSGGAMGPHVIQGIGVGFVPDVLEPALIDEVVAVGDVDAVMTARRLAREEGVAPGFSGGAAAYAARQVAARLGPEQNVVVLLADAAHKYQVDGLLGDPSALAARLPAVEAEHGHA